MRAVHLIAHLDHSVRTDADFQSGRKMKTKSKFVCPFPTQCIFDQPETLLLMEMNAATVSERLRQTLITRMLCDYHVSFAVTLPTDHTRMGFIADHKRHALVGGVLLNLIDL